MSEADLNKSGRWQRPVVASSLEVELALLGDMERKFEAVLARHGRMVHASEKGERFVTDADVERRYNEADLDIQILLQEADNNGGRFADSTVALRG